MNDIDILPNSDSPAIMREKIVALEKAILQHPNAESRKTIDELTFHHFAPGVYMREFRVPKGMVITGKIHKTEHLNILSQGLMTVWTDNGMKTLRASTVIKSNPGIKRVGYAHEDSVWITVHHNVDNLSDVKLLEDMLVVSTFEELEAFRAEQKALEQKGA